MRSDQVHSDESMHSDVLDEFARDIRVPVAHIGVAVTDLLVTLSGTVRDDRDRAAAVDAARRVDGVCVILDAITVGVPETDSAADHAIASRLHEIIDSALKVPVGIALTVRNKVITMEGAVDTAHDRQTVCRLATYPQGVNWVRDNLTQGSVTAKSRRRIGPIRVANYANPEQPRKQAVT